MSLFRGPPHSQLQAVQEKGSSVMNCDYSEKTEKIDLMEKNVTLIIKTLPNSHMGLILVYVNLT
jgi:hypothetical protein